MGRKELTQEAQQRISQAKGELMALTEDALADRGLPADELTQLQMAKEALDLAALRLSIYQAKVDASTSP
jgi:hypothetical protein